MPYNGVNILLTNHEKLYDNETQNKKYPAKLEMVNFPGKFFQT